MSTSYLARSPHFLLVLCGTTVGGPLALWVTPVPPTAGRAMSTAGLAAVSRSVAFEEALGRLDLGFRHWLQKKNFSSFYTGLHVGRGGRV